MKFNRSITLICLYCLLAAGLCFTEHVYAETDDAELRQEQERLELVAKIEKAKADIAGYKKSQQEAEKAELAAMAPSATASAPLGTLDATNFGSAGLVVAVDLAKDIAPLLCDVIENGHTALIYDSAQISGIISAKTFDYHLTLFQKALTDSLAEKDDSRATKVFAQMLTGLEIPIAVGTVKAAADLASLFKTNITVKKTDYTDAKSLLLSAMANRCSEKLISVGTGYNGELDDVEIKALQDKAFKLLNDKARLDTKINKLKKALESAKEPEKTKIQKQYDELDAVSKLVDAFIVTMRTNETSDKSPIPIAAKYLTLSKRTQDSYVYDIDIKLEGLSILKENIFTGQHLKLSATAIVWYRLHDKSGKILNAGVLRGIERPIKINLRGEEAGGPFWELK